MILSEEHIYVNCCHITFVRCSFNKKYENIETDIKTENFFCLSVRKEVPLSLKII